MDKFSGLTNDLRTKFSSDLRTSNELLLSFKKYDVWTLKAFAIFSKFDVVIFPPILVSYRFILWIDTPDLLAKSSCVQPFSERKNLIF